MKIAIGTIFYNSYKELLRLVDSIPPNSIDYFIGIDGVFRYVKEKFPYCPDLSDSMERVGLLLGAAETKNLVSVLVDKPNSTEYEKRNAYLETCEKLGDVDILIIVDSDEYFCYADPTITPQETWNRFKKNLEIELIKTGHQHNVFGIPTYDVATKTGSYCPRIWYKPGEMRYLNNSHYHYGNVIREAKEIENFKKQKLNYVQHARAIIKAPLILNHDHSLRSQEYNKRREDYQKFLVRYEELVQSYKYDDKRAYELAKQRPHESFEPTK